MQESLDASLVRIRTVDGGVIGAGFLVGEQQILTCAHVVSQACNLTDHLLDVPQGLVSLDFPLISPRTLFTAKVVQWCPLLADGRGDIAGLELQSEPPAGTELVRFAPAEDVWEHAFRAFGFPTGYDDGVWATGRLLGRQATDWVMIEDVKAQGFAVGPGFSGTPVWDTQLQGVVGMVVAASRPADTKAAFVLPLDVLVAAWPRIEPITRQRVFLSAAPADAAFADRLAADLEARDIVVWSEQHTPGEGQLTLQERLRQAIRTAQAVVLVVSSLTRSSRTVEEHLRLADLYARRLILVRVGNEEPVEAPPPGLRETVWVDARDPHYAAALDAIEVNLSQRRTISALLGPTHEAPEEESKEPRNPYKGLRAFTADDAQDFFGRDRLVDELVKDVERLLAVQMPTHDGKRLLPIIGPSGSGKSSVVMAGLLPRLKQGALPGSKDWVYLEPMIPGKHPIEALGLTLKHRFPETSFKSLREDLEDDAARGLHVLAKQLAQQPGDRVVLFIDQFEELFTQTVPEDERRSFIELLLTAVTESRGPLIVLLTLRADFYDRPMQYAKLGQLIKDNHKAIFPMEVGDLRAVIEQPAALPDVQLTFEGNLVGDLLFDAGGEVGALPLLEFTLDQLFQRREGHRLTLSAYQEIGGVKGALGKHAEATYAQLPSDEHRKMARALFLRLIDPGTTEQDSTRRRAALSELELLNPEQTAMMREVADAFIIARLLTTSKGAGNTTIEVSHEALIREWNRLTAWLHEAREDIALQQAIATDTAEWQHRGRPSDRLYHGTHLTEVQAWAERNVPSRSEVAFLQAAEDERRQQEQAELNQKARELDLQRRAGNRLRLLIATFSVFSVLSIVLASVTGVTLVQTAKQLDLAAQAKLLVEQQVQVTRSSLLAADANFALSQNQLDLALLLSRAAYQTYPTYEARSTLFFSLEKSSQLVTMLHAQQANVTFNPVLRIAFSPTDSTMLVSASYDHIYVWNNANTKTRNSPTIIDPPAVAGASGYIGGMALSPDGQKLALSSAFGVWLQNIQAGSQPISLDGKEGGQPNGAQVPTPITFTADGKLVLSARCDNYGRIDQSGVPHCTSTKISTYGVATKQLVGSSPIIMANADSAVFRPHSQTLATISDANTIQFWEMKTGKLLNEISTGSTETITRLAFSADGNTLATVGKTSIQLWDVSTGSQRPSSPFAGHTNSITDVTLNHDGSQLAASSMDNTVTVWDVASGKLNTTLTGNGQAKESVAFSPDGTMLASGTELGTILLWKPSAKSTLSQQVVSTGNLNNVLFTPDGKFLLVGRGDGKVLVYDAQTMTPINTLSTEKYPLLIPDSWSIESLALGGGKLVAGRLDGTIVLWDIKTWQPLPQPFIYTPHDLSKVMLSADGRVLAVTGSGDKVLLWDVASRKSLPSIPYPRDESLIARPLDLSPDGKALAIGQCSTTTNGICAPDQLQFWDVFTGKMTDHTSPRPGNAISDLAFSPDRHSLAFSNSDGIILWDIAQNKQQLALPFHPDQSQETIDYSVILFSPDGKRLVFYSSPTSVFSFIIWDLTSQPPEPLVQVINEEGFSQGNIAFSPDGQHLASVSVPISSPGRSILTLWDLSIASWLERACTIANRNLRVDERNQFVKGDSPISNCPDIAA